MVVSVFARGVTKEKLAVEFEETSVGVVIQLVSGSEYQMNLSLFHKIVPSECKYSVGPTKVIIIAILLVIKRAKSSPKGVTHPLNEAVSRRTGLPECWLVRRTCKRSPRLLAQKQTVRSSCWCTGGAHIQEAHCRQVGGARRRGKWRAAGSSCGPRSQGAAFKVSLLGALERFRQLISSQQLPFNILYQVITIVCYKANSRCTQLLSRL